MDKKEDMQSFGAYIAGVMNAGLVTPAIAVGSNLGLFDVMINLGKPSSCEDIAKAGEVKERYVREWLGVMVTGKIVDYNDEDKTFSIPDHRIPFLSKKGAKNMTQLMCGVPVVTEVVKDLEECFKPNGPRGLPYSSYKNLYSWRMSYLNSDFKWKYSETILAQLPELRKRLESGISVCDAGCSSAVQVKQWAEHFPNSTFLGYDIDQPALDSATQDAKQMGLKNISFVYQDGCNMPADWSEKFDFVMVYDVVHDVPYPKQFLKGIHRSLKPGGTFVMVEIKMHTSLEKNRDALLGPALYGFSFFHCMPVSLYYEGGAGLGACWGIEKQRQYLEEAGFTDIRVVHSEEEMQAYNVCKRPE